MVRSTAGKGRADKAGRARASRKQRSSLRRRRGTQIARTVMVEAAATLFAHRGYHGTTIELIADAAGYSPAAIYKHFRNKEELFACLWTEMADRLRQVFVEGGTLELPFVFKLRWVVTRLSKLLETNPEMLIAFLAQRPHIARRAQSELERQASLHYRRYNDQVVAFVEQGIAEAVLREGPADDFALLFIGLLQAFAYRWIVSEGGVDISAHNARLIELFLGGAGRGPVAEGGR